MFTRTEMSLQLVTARSITRSTYSSRMLQGRLDYASRLPTERTIDGITMRCDSVAHLGRRIDLPLSSTSTNLKETTLEHGLPYRILLARDGVDVAAVGERVQLQRLS